MRGDLVVLGVGARVATGLDALTTAMTVRARKSFVRESAFVDDKGEPIALCRVSSLPDDLVGRERVALLAAPALAEAVAGWAKVRFTSRGQSAPAIPLLLAAPEEGDATDPRGERLLAKIAERSGVAIDLARSKQIADGRAAGVLAIEQAAARIARGDDEVVLVGGADSYFDPDRLEALDAARRLHGPGTENGFIPGEGAAFVLLGSRRRAGGDTKLASVAGVGTEREPRPYGSAEPCHALAITLAMKRALGALGPARVGWALSDVVDERHRVDEWLMGSARVQSLLTEDVAHETPLSLTGDLGAASAPLLVVLACMGWATGAAPAELALVASHSDGAARGALLLAKEAS